MRRSGYTLIEFVVVMAIVAVLTAILAPVFANARRSAHIQSSLSRMRQIHVAMVVYQTDQGGIGSYGRPADMGLPTLQQIERSRFGLPVQLWQTACTPEPGTNPNGITFRYGVEDTPGFVADAQRFRDDLVVVADLGCNDPGTPLRSKYFPHRGLGVLLGGNLVNRLAPGDSGDLAWWIPALQN